MNEYTRIRLEKLNKIAEERNDIKYIDRYEKKNFCVEITEKPENTLIKTAGRIVSLRTMGNLSFGHILDQTGKSQICLNKKTLQENYKKILETLDIGDFVGITGQTFTTKTGEKTLNVENIIILSKSLRMLPEKFHGIKDPEILARKRYLDLIMNEKTRNRFETRHKIIKYLRNLLDNMNYVEVETPVLQANASGAMAKLFITKHNALDMEMYLRISPETYLKRLIAGGYDRVYEIAKNFRNEGIDNSHLQEFTMLEYYHSYWNYRDNIEFTKKFFPELVKAATGDYKVVYEDKEIDFSKEFEEITYRDLIMKYTGIDIETYTDYNTLKEIIKEKFQDFDIEQYVSYSSLLDNLYKKYCRPNLIQPIFIISYPAQMIPLARKNDADNTKIDMYQLLVNGWELIKGYSELVDPIDQKERLLDQLQLRESGDEETMMMEEDFIECMEYGMPPISGAGLGIDRLTTLLTNTKNIKDTVFFPNLR
jgi:lysyl-tRNA synthetase class 2